MRRSRSRPMHPAAPIAGAAKTTPHDRLYVEFLMEAITCNPPWEAGGIVPSAKVCAGVPASGR